MFDLCSFGLTDMLECSSDLRRLGSRAASMEEAAGEVVRYLYTRLIDKRSDQPALALVRLYKTHRFCELEPDLRVFAAASSPAPLADDSPCLTLLGTAGDEPEWNDRRLSRAHRAIPLQDIAAVANSPMVYELTRQLGFDESDVVRPDPALFHSIGGRPGGVFYVPDARGSAHVPAQHDFVERYGIRSVIGFGGVLPSGYVFAVVMFAKVEISAETASVFESLAFAAQLALLPFVEGRLFESDPPDVTVDLARELRKTEAEATALGHLLDTRHHIVTEQAARLEQTRREAEDRAEALARSQERLQRSEAMKAAILDAALDCIISMDEDGRIVDFNPAAERTFGIARDHAIGRSLAEVIIPPRHRAAHEAGLARYLGTGTGDILGRRIEIEAVRADGSEIPVELTVVAVSAGGVRRFSGHVRDITDRRRAEGALREASERYAHIARTLQASLLPPALPNIPNIELAAAYRPGHAGLDVGGDFYDVFNLGGRWGIVLGDVMGKGAEAAATTALARHTVRAAAIGIDDPTEVLRVLNEALYRDNPERFSTAVYATLDTNGAVRLALALGGHPPPLLRRQTEVVELGSPGMILGPFPDWQEGSTAHVELRAGDLLFLYSDGVPEARRGHDEFGLSRLRAILANSAGDDAATTVQAVGDAIDAFTTGHADDVTMLAFLVG